MELIGGVETVFLVLTLLIGLIIFALYAVILYWRLYAGGQNLNTVQWLWAGFYNTGPRIVWSASASIAVVSYLVLFGEIVCNDVWGNDIAWLIFSIVNRSL